MFSIYNLEELAALKLLATLHKQGAVTTKEGGKMDITIQENQSKLPEVLNAIYCKKLEKNPVVSKNELLVDGYVLHHVNNMPNFNDLCEAFSSDEKVEQIRELVKNKFNLK